MFHRQNNEIDFNELNFNDNKISNEDNDSKMTFGKLIDLFNENFIIISQKDKASYLQLTLSDIINFFSVSICTKNDGRTKCRYNCDCLKSLDIGMQIYEKGGVQNFHQFGNFVIGCVIEQQTDPLTRVTIEFEKSTMKNIKRIYCPCKIVYCPHAFAVLYFRLKIQSFYAIKLPQQLFNNSMDQKELVKFYGYIVEESRSLPLMCDYQIKDWSFEKFKQYADSNSSMMYAYCHKSLLPIPYNIIEEQSRARKWMSDLAMKRSLSCHNLTQQYQHHTHNQHHNQLVNSASEYNFGNRNKHNHFNSQPQNKLHHQPSYRMKHNAENYNPMAQNKPHFYNNNNNNKNTMNNHHQGGPNPYLYKPTARNRKHHI